ncbi:MAG TPA: hypothetical protein VFB96_03520 [Pirellulaceae bacterium]|nr:hypothetical protein [Pirellulaceae bacterium]
MEFFILLAQQAQESGNPIIEGAFRGAIFGGIIGAVVGGVYWGIKKLAGAKPKT